MNMTYQILVTDPLNTDGLKPLLEDDRFELTIETNLTKETLMERIQHFDALLVRSQTEVTKELIEKGHQLKIIGRAGVGIDNIDINTATEHGIMVVNAPGGNTNSAAEHTIAMMLSLARHIPQAHFSLQQKEWKRSKFLGVEVKNKTLGIIGFGNVGAEVAYRAKGQRMNVIVSDPFLTEERAEKYGVNTGSIDEILASADFLTVHTPLVPATKHLLNRDAFKKAKQGMRIINCARGGIIDEKALYDAIQDGIVSGAALDVFEEEPAIHNPLLNLDEVITTPHLGGSTVEAQRNVAVDISEDIISFLTKGLVEHPVNLPSVPNETMHKVKPFINLAEKLGVFISSIQNQSIEEIEIHFKGDLTEQEISPLTRSAVKGILQQFFGEEANDVNALYLASQKEIEIHEKRTQQKDNEVPLLTLQVKSKQHTHTVSGTYYAGVGERITNINEYQVNFIPKGHLLFIHHHDKPGAIGRMGSILGQHDINIATMQVDRKNAGGDAMMFLTIDKHPNKSALKELTALNEIQFVIPIDF